MNEYRIEKLRRPVTVHLAGGECIDGVLFVSSAVPYRPGPEEPADLFNAPEPFVPLELPSGDVVILAKQRVAEVESGAPPALDAEQMAALRPSAIEVTLAGGEMRSGFLHLAVRHERARLLDYLNALPDQFLVLYGTEGVRLLNRAMIERIRPLD